MGDILIYSIGFLAQIFFSARVIFQWVLSERARKVVSPSIFWIFSIAGSLLLCVYGWLRNDFSIILGQFIAYYIYLWNLNSKGVLKQIHFIFRVILLLTPIATALLAVQDIPTFINTFFRNESVPIGLLIFGSAGQVIFTLRFVYQWFYSVRRHESLLPKGFWIISLIGSSVILCYGVFRLDPVLILGQPFGLVSYIRNLMIGSKEKQLETAA